MNINDLVKQVMGRVARIQNEHAAIQGKLDTLERVAQGQRSITAEMDAIPGRRIYYNLTGRLAFNITDDGRRGQPINMLVSQDGPFIQTHYPMAVAVPTAPANADMLGLWRPVSPWPLPNQFAIGTVDGDSDLVSISYEVTDSGSQRNFQNEAAPPILSRPDAMMPLPVPTLFTPNTTIQFIPTFERILFNNAGVPATDMELVVTLPGYRIVNL